MNYWDKIKSFSTLYENLMEPLKKKYELNQLELDILMFLNNNPQYDTANEIVKIRHLTKSNVSSAVDYLEKRKLLKRERDEKNRKIIHLSLLSSADKIIADGKKIQLVYGKTLIHGFSKEEKTLFKDFFERVCANTDEALKRN